MSRKEKKNIGTYNPCSNLPSFSRKITIDIANKKMQGENKQFN